MVLKDFKLLITTARGDEDNACSEIWYLLKEVGDEAAIVDRTNVAGLIAAKTSLDPFEVIKRFRDVLRERPYEFRYSIRIIPIEKVVPTDLNEIERVATEMGGRIGKDETFRVTVEKRYTSLSTRDIIEAAASNIERKVDLTKPDRILLVEVVGSITGISLIKPDDVLSVTREKGF